MMILKLLLILLLCALNAQAGGRRGPRKSRPSGFPTTRRSERRAAIKDAGPRVIPSYHTESQGRYYAFGSGAELKSWGGNYYQMEDECDRRGSGCWGFQTTFGCADRLGCGQALILSDPGDTRKISVPGTTVYRKADVPWTEEDDNRCDGLWKDTDAETVGACEVNCYLDDDCLVYQWMSGNTCWRGKPSSCCPSNNVPGYEILEGYRKPDIQFIEFLTQCQGLDWDRHTNSASTCQANCELDIECEIWQFYNNRNDCWRGKREKCHGDRPADSGGYKLNTGVCDETLQRCCSYNHKYGMIPGETWGSTPEEAKDWHTRNNCDILMGGSELKYCPYSCDTCDNSLRVDSTFTERKDWCIDGFNLETFDEKTFSECESFCSAAPECLSFDWRHPSHGYNCALGSVASSSTAHNTNCIGDGWDYYEKRMVSQYTERPDWCIDGHNEKTYDNTDYSTCEAHCTADSDCRSFDWRPTVFGYNCAISHDISDEISHGTNCINEGWHNYEKRVITPYTEKKEWCIDGHNAAAYSSTSLSECESHCDADAECRSFEWRDKFYVDNCNIHHVASYEISHTSFGCNQGWNYYEKRVDATYINRENWCRRRSFDWKLYEDTTISECEAYCTKDSACRSFDWKQPSDGFNCAIQHVISGKVSQDMHCAGGGWSYHQKDQSWKQNPKTDVQGLRAGQCILGHSDGWWPSEFNNKGSSSYPGVLWEKDSMTTRLDCESTCVNDGGLLYSWHASDLVCRCYNKVQAKEVTIMSDGTWKTCLSRDYQYTQCAGDFGSVVGDPVCCGEEGTIAEASHVCPEDFPICRGFVQNVQWGACEKESNFPPTPAQEYTTLFSSAICAEQFWIDQTGTDTSEDECQELCDWRNDCETYCYSSEKSLCLLYTGCSVTEPAFKDGTPVDSYTCKSSNPPPAHEYSMVLSGATCGYSFVTYGQDAVATADECEFLCDSRDDCDTYCFSSDAGGEWECMLYSSCATVDPNTARWGTHTCKSQGNYEFFFSHVGHCAEGWDGSNTFQRSLEECSEECSAREGSQFFSFCDSNPQDCDNGKNCACYNDDSCPDDGTWKQYKAYEIGECARTETAACDGISDKWSCLSSVESRSLELNGVQLNGSNCVWCPNGACTSNNDNRCEPQIWLDTMPHSGYDMCLSDVAPTPQEYTTLFSSAICADQFWIDQTGTDTSEDECQQLCDGRNDCETYCYSSEKSLCLLYTGCSVTEPAFNDGTPVDSYTCKSSNPPPAHEYSMVLSGATCGYSFVTYGQDAVATADECEFLCDSRDDCDTYCFSSNAGGEWECMLYSSCATVDPNTARWGTYTCKSQGNYEFFFSHVGECAEGWDGSNTLQRSLEECSEECSAREGSQFFSFCDSNPQDCDNGKNCACYNDDLCTENEHWKQYKAYEIGECARTETAACDGISDRMSCLSSVESRSLELNGVQLNGSNCVWCPNGACTSNNENRCEPQIWLDTMPHSGYEMCLSDFSSGNRLTGSRLIISRRESEGRRNLRTPKL